MVIAKHPVRVVHLTSVHPADDNRIFHKECVTLAAAGYDVTLVVAGGRDEQIKGVRIVSVRRTGGRIGRAVFGSIRLGRVALRSKAAVIHFHDPELLPLGLVLRLLGRNVIYDAHEWVRGSTTSRPYLNPRLAHVLASAIGGLEWVASRVLTHVVAATPFIASLYKADNVTVIANYPDLGELSDVRAALDGRDPACGVYVGGINEGRCGSAMIAAVPKARAVDPRIHLVMGGPLEDGLHPEVVEGIEYRGVLSRPEVVKVNQEASFGLALLRPLPNYIDSLPTKFFEYLAVGIPAVVSRSTTIVAAIVEEVGCGLIVDGEDSDQVAAAMVQLAADPERTRLMGERGAAAVRDRYTWSAEAVKLVALYDRIVGDKIDRTNP